LKPVFNIGVGDVRDHCRVAQRRLGASKATRKLQCDAEWLSSFQKIQLTHLVVELMGKVNAPAPERKKSELVESVAKLFADAADGKLEDKKLAERLNSWVPTNLREVRKSTATIAPTPRNCWRVSESKSGNIERKRLFTWRKL